MKRLLAVAAIVLIAAACGIGEATPTAGYVQNKQFEPSHWKGGYRAEDRYGFHCGFGYDGKYDCGLKSYTEDVWDDHYEWVTDRWSLQLQDCKVENDKNHCNTGWIPVDETTFHQYAVGQHYPNPK